MAFVNLGGGRMVNTMISGGKKTSEGVVPNKGGCEMAKPNLGIQELAQVISPAGGPPTCNEDAVHANQAPLAQTAGARTDNQNQDCEGKQERESHARSASFEKTPVTSQRPGMLQEGLITPTASSDSSSMEEIHDQVEDLFAEGNVPSFSETNMDATFDDIMPDENPPHDNNFGTLFHDAAPATTPHDFAAQAAIATHLPQTALQAQSCDVSALIAQMREDMEQRMKEEITKAREDMERQRDADKRERELEKKGMEERHHVEMGKVSNETASHDLLLLQTCRTSE